MPPCLSGLLQVSAVQRCPEVQDYQKSKNLIKSCKMKYLSLLYRTEEEEKLISNLIFCNMFSGTHLKLRIVKILLKYFIE
jgi:hypothetical protein